MIFETDPAEVFSNAKARAVLDERELTRLPKILAEVARDRGAKVVAGEVSA